MMNFVKNLKGEFAHIVWPSQSQVTWFTVAVIVVSVLVAYYLGLFDFIFMEMLSQFLVF